MFGISKRNIIKMADAMQDQASLQLAMDNAAQALEEEEKKLTHVQRVLMIFDERKVFYENRRNDLLLAIAKANDDLAQCERIIKATNTAIKELENDDNEHAA